VIPERWQQISDLFVAARQKAPSTLDHFLDEACQGDLSLRARIENLLAQDAAASQAGFLATPCPRPDAPLGKPLEPGFRLGPYEITRPLGSGGMGDVYLAVRVDDYRQEVAIKVVRAGREAAEAWERFRTERQVLAGLRHPNIARLLDGGTSHDGQPYLVMEYIEGVPVDQYCETRGLERHQSMQIFLLLCQGVAHAHEREIIHRDLKPTNVLVRADGTPIVTDFGLAKHLAADIEQTQTGELLGTPRYMAPEQAAGQRHLIGPWTDVHSLGVILYKLLTGRHPFQGATMRDTLEQVCTHDPVAPRRLQSSLARDLDTICLKCLEKEPYRRYANAGALAEDVARFLAGEPVQARPVGSAGKLMRWSRRNPVPAGLLAALILVMLAALASVTALWRLAAASDTVARHEASNAIRQRGRAEARERLARRALEDLYTRVAEDRLAHEPRMQDLQRAVLKKALVFYEELLADDPLDQELRYKTSQAYSYVGRIESIFNRTGEAEKAFRRQIALLESLAAEEPANREYRFDLFFSHMCLGFTLAPSMEKAEESHLHALSIIRQLAEEYPEEPNYRDALANQEISVAGLLCGRGKNQEGEKLYQTALETAEQLVREFPNRTALPEYSHNVVTALIDLGNLQMHDGRLKEAEASYRRAMAVSGQLIAKHPSQRAFRLQQVHAERFLGMVLYVLGSRQEATAAFCASLQGQEQLAKEFPSLPGIRIGVVTQALGLACHYLAIGQEEKARSALAKARKLLDSFTPEERLHERCAVFLLCLPPDATRQDGKLALELIAASPERWQPRKLYEGLAYYRMGDWDRCISVLNMAMTETGSAPAATHFLLAMARWRRGEHDEARRICAKASKQHRAAPFAEDWNLIPVQAEAERLVFGSSKN
jgi:tetratricopeptide (TPR) repeat protein